MSSGIPGRSDLLIDRQRIINLVNPILSVVSLSTFLTFSIGAFRKLTGGWLVRIKHNITMHLKNKYLQYNLNSKSIIQSSPLACLLANSVFLNGWNVYFFLSIVFQLGIKG